MASHNVDDVDMASTSPTRSNSELSEDLQLNPSQAIVRWAEQKSPKTDSPKLFKWREIMAALRDSTEGREDLCILRLLQDYLVARGLNHTGGWRDQKRDHDEARAVVELTHGIAAGVIPAQPSGAAQQQQGQRSAGSDQA